MKQTPRLMFRACCWIAALALLTAGSAWLEVSAQEAPGPAAGNAPTEPEAPADEIDGEGEAGDKSQTESIGMLIVESGAFGVVFFVLLGIFSLVATMVTVERFVNLRRGTVVPQSFVRQLHALLDRNDLSLEELKRYADSSRTPVALVLQAGIFRAGRPVAEVEKSMEDAVAREMAAIRARNRPLSVIGTVAPLVGLLGTVVGMIFVFGTASKVGVGQGEAMAEGIYLALFTTAAGLAIAIPCLLFNAWFNARIDRFMRDIDVCLLDTMPHFARFEQAALARSMRSEGPRGVPAAVEQAPEDDEELSVPVGNPR